MRIEFGILSSGVLSWELRTGWPRKNAENARDQSMRTRTASRTCIAHPLPLLCSLRPFAAISLTLLSSLAFAAPLPKTDPEATRFWIIPEKEAYNEARTGMVMVCPSHKHGTTDQAFAKLQQLIADRPSSAVNTIWVCRTEQMVTLRHFAPIVDQVFVNPFVYRSDSAPPADSAVWSGLDHPVINGLRDIRMAAPNTRLIACVDLAGEDKLFGKARPGFDEVAWMTYAVIGAGFQGIVLRGMKHGNLQNGAPFQDLIPALGTVAGELGRATPVKWAVGSPADQPVAILLSERKLFIVAIRPSFLHGTRHRRASFPDTGQPVATTVAISPPEGINIHSPRVLSGLPFVAARVPNGDISLPLRFSGAGTILVLDVDRAPFNQRDDTTDKQL